MAGDEEQKAKKKLLYALADLLAASKKGIIATLVGVILTLAAIFAPEIKDGVGFKRAVSDTVELSETDQKLLHDVAFQMDQTAKTLGELKVSHEKLADEFHRFTLELALSGRRLSDARVHR